jgi:Flp pilus assembly protein TadG
MSLRFVNPMWMHRARRGRRQLGQSLLFVALMFIVLIGVVGLAVDGAVAYAYSVAVERGAAAAALAGAPFMPQQFNAPANDNAFDRATAEAARNGYVNGVNGATVSIPNQSGSPQLSVTITQQAPTFFMHALGFPSITVSRTAVAGYRPPIALGQPGAQLGSTVSNLGTGTNFYFPRFKGWNNNRSEGDAFTPNPQDAGGSTSTDVHQYSDVKGTEDPEVACNGSGPLGATWALPCRGGFNYRIFVPANVTAELDVYNAVDGPDFGANKNKCENSKNVNTCNASGYHYHEDDNGAKCPCTGGNSANQDQYNAAGYTLFKVPDLFLRQNDKALVQTKVLPIDATNWDGNNGGTGQGGTNPPSYVNVNTDAVITQTYASGAAGAAPTNMKLYHAWADINNYTTASDAQLIQRKTANGWAGGNQLTGGAGGTYYRLRIDALKFDGSVSNTGSSSHGWAVHAVNPGTQADCTGCQVAAWNDLTIYTPLSSGTGRVPLFQLPKEYAGSTIDVDVFDVGDSAGTVNLSILDPNNALAIAQTTDLSTLNEWNEGISRFNADQTCASGCVQHSGNQTPAPKPLGPIAHTQSYQATYEASNPGYCNNGCGQEYQGSWIRIEIPIPPECGGGQNPPACYRPPASPNDYWQLQYVNSGGANDTFTFAVSAKGGPVHLVSS